MKLVIAGSLQRLRVANIDDADLTDQALRAADGPITGDGKRAGRFGYDDGLADRAENRCAGGCRHGAVGQQAERAVAGESRSVRRLDLEISATGNGDIQRAAGLFYGAGGGVAPSPVGSYVGRVTATWNRIAIRSDVAGKLHVGCFKARCAGVCDIVGDNIHRVGLRNHAG